VTIIGYEDLPSRLPKQASTLYATNLLRLAKILVKTKSIEGDRIAYRHAGRSAARYHRHRPGRGDVAAPPHRSFRRHRPRRPARRSPSSSRRSRRGTASRTDRCPPGRAVVLFGVRRAAVPADRPLRPASFSATSPCSCSRASSATWSVWNVKPSLHTPLMSVTNAVSSIIAIGALVQLAPDLTKISADLSRPNEWIRWLSVGGIALAAINMFGGFAVTQRMLSMFRK
jgi:NAD(P) transhydrogenase subunit alpha